MSDKLETILQQMQELTTTVKEHKADSATLESTLEWKDIEETFGAQIEAMVEQQVKEKLESQPVYRVPGEAIGPEGAGLDLKGNRYARNIKDFRSGGYSRFGTQVLKPFDLWLANAILEAQLRNKHASIAGEAYPPSEDLKAALKALTSTGTATGDELVPTEMATELWQDFFLASRIVSTMATIPMPTNPFDVPLGLGDVTWRKGSQNTATTSSDPATAKSTLTVTELVTEQNWSYTLDEDAVVAMAPAIRTRLAISGAEVIDAFALNADATNAATGNINLDDADPADDSYYISDGQDGIRHLWLVDNSTQGVDAGGDALADADILSMLKLMGKYAVNPEQAAMVVDVSTYLKGLLNMDAVITVDKFGPEAVVKTGQLAAYRGIPIVVSASGPLTEADGKVSTTSASNTLGQISCWNTLMWYAGFRRDLLIEMDRDIQKRQYIMVTSLREAVAARGTRSSATHTAGIYNILV